MVRRLELDRRRMMPDGLYETDALAWSEKQADLLRRHSGGELLNEAVDWPNIIEEIETVGRSELHACESLLRQAMVHLLKLYAWPNSGSAPHWRGEVLAFLDDARRHFAPSMRQRIELADLYAHALRQAGVAEDASGPPRALPPTCPFSLEDLLAREVNFNAFYASLA